MKRISYVGIAALATAAVTTSAFAGQPFPENEYEGRAEGDRFTYVGFDVTTGERRKVKNINTVLRYNCDNGFGGPGFVPLNGKLRVNDRGRFRGVLTEETTVQRGMGPSPTNAKFRISGKLLRRGKARGKIDAEIRPIASPRGGGASFCYSGGLDWRAKRGAEVTPANPGP